jgi:hypothetical protein
MIIYGLNYTCTAQTKYEKVDDEVYAISNNGRLISNTKNIKIDKIKKANRLAFYDTIPYTSIVESVFSKEKIQCLSSGTGSFMASLIINSKGEIVNIEFIRSTHSEISFDDYSENNLTLKELSIFEKELKHYKITINDKSVEENNFYHYTKIIHFADYLH